MNLEEFATTIGRHAIPYRAGVVLECYRPASHTPDKPVVLVQHGMGRNGDEYRDAWIPAADRHGLLIVAPTFPLAAFSDARAYNDGHVRAEDGTVRDRRLWSNGIPAEVLADLRRAGVTARPRAYLWGHSAGGQFVHRLLALQPHEPFEAVGAGNSGWYTFPTLDRPYPEGLGGIGLDEAALRRWLAYPLVVFAGDRDSETDAANLPTQPAALAQGPHRFARAHAFLAAGHAAAAQRGMACAWTLIVVPGIGHEGFRMSAVAADYWFDGKLPQAASEGREVGTEA